jgi:hypothetical protein
MRDVHVHFILLSTSSAVQDRPTLISLTTARAARSDPSSIPVQGTHLSQVNKDRHSIACFDHTVQLASKRQSIGGQAKRLEFT